jgi:hypothetical protein
VVMLNTNNNTNWTELSRAAFKSMDKDARAQELAKVALGWDAMPQSERMKPENMSALINRATEIKAVL